MGCLIHRNRRRKFVNSKCTNSTSTSAAIKNTALGEGYFMRAYNYLRLVQQYGAVPLQLHQLQQ